MASTSGLGDSVPGSNPPTVSRYEANQLSKQVQRLLNRQLSSICQINGVKSTGVKAELQQRINALIEEALHANDGLRFQQIRQSVLNTIATTSANGSSPGRGSYVLGFTTSPSTNIMPPRVNFGSYSPTNHTTHSNHAPAPPRLQITFRQSPFYKVEKSIGDVHPCEVMAHHRNSVTVPLKLQEHPELQKCVDDKTYRVMVFCASDSSPSSHNISFPHQSELRVNGGDIKANLRGLKNKPGSTRPVDITQALRLRGSYGNTLEFTYALTNKKYYLVVNLCKVTSVEQLVTQIANGIKISTDAVRQEFKQKNQDPDVVATSQVLSLKCPLSYMRLSIPCRSLNCSHIQCFDATSYLQLQEQGPQWLCPICNKAAPFERLAVDSYVREILDSTSSDLETVTIEPDGRWFVKKHDEERAHGSEKQGAESHYDQDDDSDELEISEVNVIGRRLETPRNMSIGSSTPVSSSRGPSSTGPRGVASTSAKRPAAAVIDLTLSSDDDEPSQPPPKRQNTGTNGFHSPNILEFPNGAHGYAP